MKKILIALCALTFALLSCNLPQALTPIAQDQSQVTIATVVAQTMQAVASQPPTATMAALSTPTAAATPSSTPTPVAVVNTAVTCHSGPNENDQSVTELKVDQKVTILGKDPTGSYWLVQTDAGNCWVGTQSVTVTGNLSGIPELTPVPSPAVGAPAAPTEIRYSYACSSPTQVTITLTWTDSGGNETGYHVYRNGNLIANLPANSTTYTDNTSRTAGSTFSYGVEAFNSFGASSRTTTESFNLSGCTNP